MYMLARCDNENCNYEVSSNVNTCRHSKNRKCCINSPRMLLRAATCRVKRGEWRQGREADRSPQTYPTSRLTLRTGSSNVSLGFQNHHTMSSRSTDEVHRIASSDVSADERTLYDPESDDEGYDGRPSGELLAGDHDILDSEDERDRLLTQKDGLSGMFGKNGVRIGKLSQKAEKKERKKGHNEETSALMYEMEEGIGQSSTSLRSRRSSESDERRLLASTAQRKACQPSIHGSDSANTRRRHKEHGYGVESPYTYQSSCSSLSCSQSHTASRPPKTSKMQRP
jgi:hypothetical protein